MKNNQKGFANVVLVGVIVLIIVVIFIIWKREPWVKTFSDKQECESSTGKICHYWQCDNILISPWFDCPHGGKFWAPTK